MAAFVLSAELGGLLPSRGMGAASSFVGLSYTQKRQWRIASDCEAIQAAQPH